MKLILGSEPLLNPLTGIGYYCHELAMRYQQDSEMELLCYAFGLFHDPRELLSGKVQNTTSESAGSEVQPATFVGKIKDIAVRSKTVVKLYQKLIPYLDRQRLKPHYDAVYHSPNYMCPNYDGPKCVTIHDLSTWYFPEYHPKNRVELVNNGIKRTVDLGVHIITDSDIVKRQLVTDFSVSPSRISSIHLGASPDFHPRSSSECDSVLAKYGLGYQNFFLSVATIEPRKNILNLLHSYDLYLSKTKQRRPLILAGETGWNSAEEHQLIQKMTSENKIKYLGYIPRQDLFSLFSSAYAFVFPSLYEGFGLPVLESIQSGVPAITSENTSMSEIVNDADILVEPQDIERLADVMLRISEDVDWRNQLASDSLQRSKAFGWDKTARDHINVYQSLLTASAF